MTPTELFEKIEAHPDLIGVGVDADGIVVQMKSGNRLASRITSDGVGKLTWEQIEPVLMGVREPKVLDQMTRVVGYLSRTSNWNQSKLGELKDRRKGNYGVKDWNDDNLS